jgi:CIC family chloride channel protein
VQGATLAHPVFALFGLVAGAVAVVYNRALILAMDGMDRLPLSPGLRGMLVGAAVGALAYHAAGLVGPGEDLTRRALDAAEPLAILPALLLFRLAFSVLSYAVGAPGGIFAPLLVLGAELGLMCGLLAAALLPSAGLDPRAFAVAGMAALFTGVVRAPLTGIIIVTEMTGSTHILLPIMSACAAAMLVPTLAGSRPIYAVLRDRSAAAPVLGEAAPAPARDA